MVEFTKDEMDRLIPKIRNLLANDPGTLGAMIPFRRIVKIIDRRGEIYVDEFNLFINRITPLEALLYKEYTKGDIDIPIESYGD